MKFGSQMYGIINLKIWFSRACVPLNMQTTNSVPGIIKKMNWKKQRESQQAIEGETQKCALELRTKELKERKGKR